MIDKDYIGERFFVSFSQWYVKVFSPKDFYEIMKEFLIFEFLMKNICLLRKSEKKKTYIWYRINTFKELISLFSRYNILYTLF